MTFSCKQINPNNMKKLFSVLLAATLCIGVGWAQESVYKTLTFSSSTNSQAVSSYTATWSATINGFTWNIVNFNNNNNQWDYIKAGRKGNASVANISTSTVIDKAITKVVVTVDACTASKINSTKLYVASNASFTQNLQTITLSASAGSMTYTIPNPAENRYYKLEYDCASGSDNGLIQISKVEYYYSAAPAATVEAPVLTDEFTFWPVMNDEPSAQVTITPAAGNTVRYTTDGSTPSRTNGTAITAATTITIGATTTVKAISYVGTQTSGVVSKTYTLGPTVTGISAFKNMENGTTARLYLPDANNARTLYVNGNDAFVRDNTGAICIYNVTTNPPLQYNQHIAGWIIGTYTNYNGLPEFTASSATNSCYLVIANPVTESDVEPVEIDAEGYESHYADWVTISDLEVSAASGSTATASDINGNTFAIYNKYNPAGYQLPYEGAIVDITGIATPYNDSQQLRPINQNNYYPLTYVVDAHRDFVSPQAAIANAQVRLKRYLPSQGWSLLTVPFEVEGFEGEVMQYTGVSLGQVGTYDFEGHTYPIQGGVMHFEDYYGNLQPGIPYLVKPYYSQQEMTVSGVTLSGDVAGSVTFSLGAQNAPGVGLLANDTPAYVGDYTLVGTYSPLTLSKDEATVKLIDDNTLSWTSLIDNTDVNGTEAYITIPNGAGVKLDLAGTGVVTAVTDIRLDNAVEGAVIYNILGQRLTRPLGQLPPGVYIVNGKKIVKR